MNTGQRPKLDDYDDYILVDSYFVILEKIGDTTEDVEQLLMEDPRKEVLNFIYKLKREMIFLRNCIWPLREVRKSKILKLPLLLVSESFNFLYHIHFSVIFIKHSLNCKLIFCA